MVRPRFQSKKLELNGMNITEDEYLKNALKLKTGMSVAVRNYNLPRECILHYFHSHKCFVFDRPASKIDLQNLDNVAESQLDHAFVQQTKRFCQFIYEKSPVKSLSGGYTMTGRSLGDVAVSYVESIRSGSIPSMENAVLALAKIENSRAVHEALSKYDELMSQHVSKFPTETQDELLNLDKECHAEALSDFMKLSFKDENHEYQYKLINELVIKKAIYQQQNEQASEIKSRTLLQELSAEMEKGIREGKYSVPGGYKLFTDEKKTLEANYLRAKGKGVKSLEVLQQFLKEKESVESTILIADKTLEEKEKRLAEQKSQAEAASRAKEILERTNMELEKNLASERESYDMHMKMLEKKISEEREKIKEENEWLIKEKLKEQEEMMKGGFKTQCQMLEDEIGRLREENRQPISLMDEIITTFLPGTLGKIVKKVLL
ncbi:unnamed protein product [Ranitomeya imitator]|uniref:GB1/RHD3-type G domain-containing protein n=1 Tax=Ranitomeya imitator TaxID=111125 RepID=A0ABN9M463_9NEOB|nr:unnamed protein product [Ranitomeya imitator]